MEIWDTLIAEHRAQNVCVLSRVCCALQMSLIYPSCHISRTECLSIKISSVPPSPCLFSCCYCCPLRRTPSHTAVAVCRCHNLCPPQCAAACCCRTPPLHRNASRHCSLPPPHPAARHRTLLLLRASSPPTAAFAVCLPSAICS